MRVAKLDRLDAIAKEKNRPELTAKVATLREKEDKRHERALARLAKANGGDDKGDKKDAKADDKADDKGGKKDDKKSAADEKRAEIEQKIAEKKAEIEAKKAAKKAEKEKGGKKGK
jgi:hypothetical protein